MRAICLVLHRWFGLSAAVFLFIAGLTGAVISWDHELDAWLNPALYEARTTGADRKPLDLVAALEAREPELQVTYAPLAVGPGHALLVFVAPREAGQALPYNQVALDPATGEVQGRRFWGAPALSRENLLPFLYKLHYSMHIPDVGGVEAGVLFMGVIGVAWVVDCLVALWLSFPSAASWRKSFSLRWKQGGFRLLFDVHRSGAVWAWLLVLTVAVTSVSMNLEHQFVRPVVNSVSPLTPSPFDAPPRAVAVPPVQSRAEVIERGLVRARELDINAPAGGVFYSPEFNVYGVGFFEPGHDHGDDGLGNPWLYFDGQTGAVVGENIPGRGSAGDLFMQAQFPLHSGRIAGVPGRIAVSLLGLLVATLSVTGVVIWARKRRSLAVARARRGLSPDPTPVRSV